MAFNKEKLDRAASATQEAGTGNKYLMVQDFDHRVVENHQLVATDEMMDAIAASGKKHITLEKMSSDQKAADNYAAGRVTRDEFVNHMKGSNGHLGKADGVKDAEAVADIIDKAKARGMQVHFVNVMEPDLILNDLARSGGTIADMKKDLKTSIDIYGRLQEKDSGNLLTDYNMDKKEAERALASLEKVGLQDNEPVSALKGKIKTPQEARLDGEKALADRIVKATNGEPTAIVEGAQHGGALDGSNGQKDLDEHLSKHGSVGKVGLAGSPSVPAKEPYKEYPNTMIYTEGFGKKPDTKIFDPSKPAGAEINKDQTPDFNVKKYQDYKPEERPATEADKKEDKKKTAANDAPKDPQEIARQLRNGELPPAQHSHADGQTVMPQADLAQNKGQSKGHGLFT